MKVALMMRLVMILSFAACFATSATAADPVRPPKVWGIIIGIDIYDDPAIPPCQGSAGDAREIRRWLLEKAGWEGTNLLLMDGNSPKEHGPREQQLTSLRPSRANLDWAVKEWLAYRVRPGDVVLISFAGQAIGGKDGDPLSKDGLLPIDARASDLDRTIWPIQDAIDGLASRGDNSVVVWMDTSLSGRGKPVASLVGRRTSASQFLLELTRWPGVIAWLSADDRPAAEPAKANERGAFVSAVLPAMGTTEKPGNILGGLFALSREPRLTAQGFRSAGGLGPEWSFWPKSLASIVRPPSELLLQRGHADRITAIVFSPDGQTMTTASRDSTIKIWRMSDRRLLRTLPAHTIGVTALALSPDGSKLASADGSGRIYLWSLPSLRPSVFLGRSPHERGIASLRFLKDGTGFASLDDDGRAVCWTISENAITPKLMTENASAIASGEDVYIVAKIPRKNNLSIHVFDARGKFSRSLDGPGGFIPSHALACRDNRIAAGNKDGVFGVWSLLDGTEKTRVQTKHPVVAVELSETAAIGASGDAVLALWSDRAIAPRTFEMPGPVATVMVSPDAKTLSATTVAGEVSSWNLADAKPIAWEKGVGNVPTTILSLSPRGEMVSGSQDGSVQFWNRDNGQLTGKIAPHRGKIAKLALSSDGHHLAQIDHDRKARIWDLRDGRDLLTIRGDWNGMAFLPDGGTLAMTRADGSVHLVDRATTEMKPITFDRPQTNDGTTSQWEFGPVAASRDGTMIVAGSPHGPLACVWPIAGGAPVLTLRDHQDHITSVGFSDDSRHVMTASLDGAVKIWPIAGGKPRWSLVAEPTEGDPGVTAASIAPGELSRLASGHADGRVLLWDLGFGEPKPTEIGRFEGPVNDLKFSSDGKSLIACGTDKSVRVWKIDGAIPPGPAQRLLPQHTEQVNELVVWPDGRLIASAGDDTTIRFWSPDGKRHLGTMVTSAEDGRWVAFTPDGQFDSAPGGEIQVSYVVGDRVMTLDQSDDSSRVFGLGRLWLEGKSPEGRSPLLVSRPPPLWLAPPSSPQDGEVELSVKLAEPGLENVRIYLNDMPVRDDSDFHETADPLMKTVRVRLAPGPNRLVAMASRPGVGGLHGRSNEVTVRGPSGETTPKGVVHSLALGIGKYQPKANALEFADRDAEVFAGFLAKHGIGEGGRLGLKLVLSDDKVTPEAVEEALMTIRARARPEDTVVVFVAGHTDVRRDRFCLLLGNFPLAPGSIKPGERGPLVASSNPEKDDPKTLIAYSSIYRILARTDALHRLVVIDACQAGAIYDDPGVRRIQDKVDDGAHRARTSYLLATRRGESASESSTLKHGLLTHLLLRGMGASDLATEPGGKFGNADADADGTVTTDELRQFVDVNLPILATRVALSASRSNPGSNTVAKPDPSRSQASGTTFPLVKIPR